MIRTEVKLPLLFFSPFLPPFFLRLFSSALPPCFLAIPLASARFSVRRRRRSLSSISRFSFAHIVRHSAESRERKGREWTTNERTVECHLEAVFYVKRRQVNRSQRTLSRHVILFLARRSTPDKRKRPRNFLARINPVPQWRSRDDTCDNALSAPLPSTTTTTTTR